MRISFLDGGATAGMMEQGVEVLSGEVVAGIGYAM